MGFPFIQGPGLSRAVSLPSLCWWQMQDRSCVSHISFQFTRRRDGGGTDGGRMSYGHDAEVMPGHLHFTPNQPRGHPRLQGKWAPSLGSLLPRPPLSLDKSLTPGLPSPSPHSSVGKESACNAGDWGSIPGSRRSPGEGNGDPL